MPNFSGETMNEEHTVVAFMPGIFTPPPYDESPPRLLGGFCPKCRKYYYPRPLYCRTCLDPVEEAVLDSMGTLYSFTIVRIKPPMGLPKPYGLGYVDLNETGLRVFGLLDPNVLDRLSIGLPVHLAVDVLGRDIQGNPCLRPYFTPITASER
jgi:uncharacterized OB-fold protein